MAALFGVSQATAVKVWDVVLLAYCFVAGVVPMWLLLQPRGHLGGYFLYRGASSARRAGLVFGGKTVQYPAFNGWTAPNGDTLFPFLFITIACGACSGFHAIVASGTTQQAAALRDGRAGRSATARCCWRRWSPWSRWPA